MQTILSNTLRSILIAAFMASSIPYLPAFAQEEMDLQDQESQDKQEPQMVSQIDLLVGDVQVIDVKNLSRVAVTNPEIVDISDAKADKVFVVGKKPGQTEVFVWDQAGKHGITARVAVENLDVLKNRLEEILSKTGIKGISLDKNVYEGKVVVSGDVSKKDKDTLDKVLDAYSDRTINLIKEEVVEDLVQVDVQITELSTTLIKQIGLDWTAGNNSGTAASSGTSSSSSTSGGAFSPIFSEIKTPSTGKIFKVNSFARNPATPIDVTVNALVQEGKGRVLSRPRLVVISGKEASFLVGGEVPIRTTTSNSGGGQTQENVSYKQYGINMTITPTIHDSKVEILLNMQVSDVDKSTQNTSTGDVGFVTRQAQTQVLLDDKQTIVLAGLIKHADGETVKGVPFLSKIPVIGAAFRTRSNGNPDSDTELVITLTPTIIKTKKYAKEQISLPSKRVESFAKEVDSHFDKESLSESTPKIETKPQVQNTAKPEATVDAVSNAGSKKISDLILPYIRQIQMRISQAITYPYEAAQKKWEGTVKLRLRILKDGSLADCDLLESSGHDVFDKDAVNTAKIVAPFGVFPAQMSQEDIVVTVPIVYNQRTVKDDAQTVVASY